jgi:hypothetical protein
MGYIGHIRISKPDGSTPDAWFEYECGHCGAKVSGAVVAYHGSIKWLLCPNCGNGSVCDEKGKIHPGAAFGPRIAGLPNDIAEAYEEARRSMSISAFSGSELICRKILMYVAIEKGAKEGESFTFYLDHLEKKGYITPPMKTWVDLIRKHGNIAAHILEKPDQNRAESTLMFTAELLRIVYEMEHLAKQYKTESE